MEEVHFAGANDHVDNVLEAQRRDELPLSCLTLIPTSSPEDKPSEMVSKNISKKSAGGGTSWLNTPMAQSSRKADSLPSRCVAGNVCIAWKADVDPRSREKHQPCESQNKPRKAKGRKSVEVARRSTDHHVESLWIGHESTDRGEVDECGRWRVSSYRTEQFPNIEQRLHNSVMLFRRTDLIDVSERAKHTEPCCVGCFGRQTRRLVALLV